MKMKFFSTSFYNIFGYLLEPCIEIWQKIIIIIWSNSRAIENLKKPLMLTLLVF